MLTSSGQAANFFALFNICECGDHIVASSSIYGGTFNLIDVTMRKMGIDVTFVSPDATEEELNAAVSEELEALNDFWNGQYNRKAELMLGILREMQGNLEKLEKYEEGTKDEI